MAKSAISIDVKAANSKLAQFLRRREEEEMILQIGKKKPKQLKEEKLPGGRGRWMLEPDYRAPTPMVDRPRTVNGATSFHFSYISISKEAIPTVNGAPVEGAFGKAKSAALEHSKYIERDGAAERSAGAQHAGYIERDGAVEHIDTSALMAEAVERQIASIINETPTAEEAELLGIVDVAPEGIPSVFSNISSDPFERQEFWRAVERAERTPKTHEIILDPEASPAWWLELQTTNRLDPAFQHHALMVAENYRQFMAKPVPEGEVRQRFIAQPFVVSAEKAGQIIQQAQRMASYADHNPPFEFKSGRGGRVQFRLVAELPYELTPEDRALIVQNFCDHLGSLEIREDDANKRQSVGMMYTAVIHAPDAHNDLRNYHLHIVAHDRPARFLSEYGQWDFEVEERFNHKGEDRIRWPHRQNKIGHVARGKGESEGLDFIPSLRRKFASITNTVLQARGIHRRLDPRKYTEMGIDRTPTDHLGTKAAALEAIGVPTAVGQLNAMAIWSDAERAIRRDAVKAERTYRTAQDDLNSLAKEVTAVDAVHPALPAFRRLVTERERMIADTATDREAVMTFDHLEAKAKSRAIRTRQTCVQFLADIESGDADRNTRMMRSVIEDRWKGAQAHIASIDDALAPHRKALAAAAANIEKREARCAEIDNELLPLITVLEERLRMAGIDRALAAKARAEAEASPPQPAAAQTPHETSHEAVEFDGTVLSIDGMEAGGSKGTDADGVPSSDVRGDDAPTVPVEPASIEGLPIVEPTIAPRQLEVEGDPVDMAKTPEGLDPLRPETEAAPVADQPEVIMTDIDAEQGRGPAEASPTPAVPSPPNAQTYGAESKVGDASINDEPISPPVDRRRKIEDPTLFDLPVQEAPAKPGTSKGEYADWDGLINRIMADRIPVKAEQNKSGAAKFSVPSLSPEDNALLHARRFQKRASGRLAAIHERQQNEIQRLTRWIGSSGQEPSALLLQGRTASLGEGVPKSIRTLFRHWATHEATISAVRAENDRRIELAKAIANQPPVQSKSDERDIETIKAHAARIYPQPDQAYTPEVRDYLRLLHEAAPERDLQSAADKIRVSASAREDINKHTVELAIAYRTHSEEFDQREAARRRNDRGGR